jgi:hypothetical protein
MLLESRLEATLGVTRRRACILLCVALVLLLVVARQTSSASSAIAANPKPAPQSAAHEYEDASGHAHAPAVQTSRQVAEELIATLLGRIGTGQGPVIVGGIGDSGTRGVRDVLVHFGATMLDEKHVVADSKDSLIYMQHFLTVNSKGKAHARSPAGLYNTPMKMAHSINYNESVVPEDFWQRGRQWVAKMIDRTMTVSQQLREAHGVAKLDPWGFKHPRTALLLPYWHSTLGGKFKFIHVLRDGKDVSQGENQIIFQDHCALYYGRACSDSIGQHFAFWADLNRDIFEYVMQSSLHADQYLAIRVEDLVVGNEACYRRLAAFVGSAGAADGFQERLQSAVKASRTHVSSYFGKKWSPGLKHEVEQHTRGHRAAKLALEFWGYDAASYNFTADCEHAPWLAALRARKGPLPGDGLT